MSFLKGVRLQNLILIFTVVFLVPLVLFLKYYQFVEHKKEIIEGFETLRQTTERNIVISIKLVDSAYHILEDVVRPNLERFLRGLASIYIARNGDIDKIDLEDFKSSLDFPYKAGLDFYIIDQNNVVIKSTYPIDIGLDFRKYPDLSAYLDKIRSGERFVLDRLTVETRTGRYRVFAYLPTPDHKYILEAGCGLMQFSDILNEYNFMRISERIKEVNPLIEYIRIYDRHGHIFGNPDFVPDEELQKRIFSLFYERKGTDFDFEGKERYFIFVDLYNPEYPTDSSKVVEIKYRTDVVKESINRAFVDVILSGILIFIISLFVAYLISAIIDRPLSRIVREIEDITAGNIEKRVSESDIFELDRLAHHINRMVDSLKGYIESLKRQQEEALRLENQLRQSQKMEAIGLLAGGIAHDFNNIMSAILGYTNLLQIQFAQNKEVRNKLDQIVSAVERGARLIKILMTFSRKGGVNLKIVDLNEIISNISKLLRRIIGEDIRLNVKFSSEPAFIMADVTNIEQVIMNLVTNSRDAMPQGGDLTIEVEVKELDRDLALKEGIGEGRYVIMRVSDTGEGIDKEILDKIFDPFFTTKSPGKGTGLGLAVVYSIIKQHKGLIKVRSEKGKGTEFEILLPFTSDTGDLNEVQSDMSFIEGGNETILLVEDDPDIRNSLRFILERYGYKVIEARDGLEGLEMFKENSNNIDLIISDVVMPELSGVKMYEKISEIKNGVKIIFISGYSEEILDQRIGREVEILFKPIPPQELLKKIRHKLNE